ncbi:MAG: hypothetical protein AAGD22_12010 [Verrucomicrobiota bacterium]
MGRRKNRYRNSLRVPGLMRWLLVVTVLVVVALSYVYMKNQYVAKSDRKKELEDETARLRVEIETLDLRIARTMDRAAIHRILHAMGSDLKRIDSSIVEHIDGTPAAVEKATMGPVLRPVAPLEISSAIGGD